MPTWGAACLFPINITPNKDSLASSPLNTGMPFQRKEQEKSRFLRTWAFFFCPGETNFHFREPCKNWFGLSLMASPGDSGQESACSEVEQGTVSGWGRSPGEGIGNPLQYPCLENSMDRGAWWARVNGVTKSQTWLSNEHFLFHCHSSLT